MFHIANFACDAIPTISNTVATATTRERNTRSAVVHSAMTTAQYRALCATTVTSELRSSAQRRSGYPIGRNAK